MKKILIISFLITQVLTGTAQDKSAINLIDCENPLLWTGKVILNKKIKRTGEFSFESFGKYPTTTVFKEFIPVNPEKTYTLSCYMRSLDPQKLASANMGLQMYDKNKKLIGMHNVRFYPGTESELLFPAKKGDKKLIVKANKEQLKYKSGWVVAFNVKENYEDLPNFNISPKGNNIIPNKKENILVLTYPIRQAYKAGTKIRLHYPYGPVFFWAAEGWMPAEWKRFSITLKGLSDYGTPKKHFWKGTKFVKPFFWFGNWNRRPAPEARLLVDDFSFVESK